LDGAGAYGCRCAVEEGFLDAAGLRGSVLQPEPEFQSALESEPGCDPAGEPEDQLDPGLARPEEPEDQPEPDPGFDAPGEPEDQLE